MKKYILFLVLTSIPFLFVNGRAEEKVLRIGSKAFTESYVLAEILAQVAEDVGEARVERKFGLGGTGITYQSLKEGEVDIYPEYTGTITEVILKRKGLKRIDEINRALEADGPKISNSLGFNNTYAVAMKKSFQLKHSFYKISDLSKKQDIKSGLSHEFTKRSDGLASLEAHYNLKFTNVVAMEHALAYEALSNNKVEMMVVYSTDAKIKKYNLKILADDRSFFPEYEAVLFYNKNFKENFPKTWAAFQEKLIGKISNDEMVSLNAFVEVDKMTFVGAAANFLNKELPLSSSLPLGRVKELCLEHLKLVLVSLFFSILVGIPLGIASTKSKLLSQAILTGTGLLQTIPSLALLCFLIPFVGIGEVPAYLALFLYGLLPIVRNTYTGLSNIDTKVLESCDLIGMGPFQKLWIVQLPIASINILGGIKTSAVINVGTATLAAFVGAGGLGKFIVTGLALNDNRTILLGAVPAAILAIVLHGVFEAMDRVLVPKGLKSDKV